MTYGLDAQAPWADCDQLYGDSWRGDARTPTVTAGPTLRTRSRPSPPSGRTAMVTAAVTMPAAAGRTPVRRCSGTRRRSTGAAALAPMVMGGQTGTMSSPMMPCATRLQRRRHLRRRLAHAHHRRRRSGHRHRPRRDHPPRPSRRRRAALHSVTPHSAAQRSAPRPSSHPPAPSTRSPTAAYRTTRTCPPAVTTVRQSMAWPT